MGTMAIMGDISNQIVLDILMQFLRKTTEAFIVLLFVVLVFAVFIQVIARYAFNNPPTWTEELARYCQVWIIILASSVCIRKGSHLAVDYLSHKFPPDRYRDVHGELFCDHCFYADSFPYCQRFWDRSHSLWDYSQCQPCHRLHHTALRRYTFCIVQSIWREYQKSDTQVGADHSCHAHRTFDCDVYSRNLYVDSEYDGGLTVMGRSKYVFLQILLFGTIVFGFACRSKSEKTYLIKIGQGQTAGEPQVKAMELFKGIVEYVIMSRYFFERLPDEYKAIIEEAAQTMIVQERQQYSANDIQFLETLKEEGVEVTYPERAHFREASQAVYEAWADKVGGMELINKILNFAYRPIDSNASNTR